MCISIYMCRSWTSHLQLLIDLHGIALQMASQALLFLLLCSIAAVWPSLSVTAWFPTVCRVLSHSVKFPERVLMASVTFGSKAALNPSAGFYEHRQAERLCSHRGSWGSAPRCVHASLPPGLHSTDYVPASHLDSPALLVWSDLGLLLDISLDCETNI